MWRVAALAVALTACGGGKRDAVSPEDAPAAGQRVETTGTSLLRLIPGEADAVLELDLARLRANPTVGPLLAAVPRRSAGQAAGAMGVPSDLGFDPLADLDVIVAAAYRLGRPDAVTLFYLRGERINARKAAASIEGATLMGDVVVVAPPDQQDRLIGLSAGLGAALDGDARFRDLRDEPMPAGATGAVVRLTVRLGVDARLSTAPQLGVDELPATLAAWGDVADDLAVVAVLTADDSASAERLAAAYPRWEQQVGSFFRGLGVPTPIAGARVRREGDRVRITWLVPPRMLEEWAAALLRALGQS